MFDCSGGAESNPLQGQWFITAECCGALLADMPLQHCVEGRDRLPFSKSGTASAPSSGDHTPYPTR